MEEKNETILRLMSNRNYGTYNKSIARAYGIEVAIILGELAGEYDYYYEQGRIDDDWFYSTSENIEYNTSLTYYQQTKAINKLIKLGVIEQKRAGIPAKRYFRFNTQKLEQVIKKIDKQFSKNLNSSFQKTSKLDVKKFELNNNNNNINNNTNNNNKNIPPHDINNNNNTNNKKVTEDKKSNSDNNLFDYIQNNFGRLLSSIEYEKISTWDDNKVTRHAVEVAILNNKHSISYVEGVLRRYKDNDVSTLEQAIAYDEKIKSRNSLTIQKKGKPHNCNTIIKAIELEPGIWAYTDENNHAMTCSEPFESGGKWFIKDGYGNERECLPPEEKGIKKEYDK